MKKNKIGLIFSLVALLSLSSCGDDPSTTSSDTLTSDDTTQTTSYPYDFVEPPTYDEDTLQIHYHRDDMTYDGWDAWLWTEGKDGAAYSFNGFDEFGAISAIPLESTFSADVDEIFFIIRQGGDDWTAKDYDSDQSFLLSNFVKDENNIYHVYIVSGWAGTYESADVISTANITRAAFFDAKTVVVNANLDFTETISNPHKAALAGFVPCAESGTITFFLCSPLTSKYFFIIIMPVSSPRAPAAGCKVIATIPVIFFKAS